MHRDYAHLSGWRGGGRPGGAGLTHVPPPLPGSGAGPSSNQQRSNMAPRLCSISAAARRLLGRPGPGGRDVAAVAAARYEPGRARRGRRAWGVHAWGPGSGLGGWAETRACNLVVSGGAMGRRSVQRTGEVGKVCAGSLSYWMPGSGLRMKGRVNERGRSWALGSGSCQRAGGVAPSQAFAVIVR